MTGVATTFAGAAVSASLFKLPPVTPGQVLWEYFGDSLAHSPNLIGANPTLIGAGQVFSPSGNYATLTPITGCLDTGIADVAGSVTVMFVARATQVSSLANPIDCWNGTGAGLNITLGNSAGLKCFVAGSGGQATLASIPGGAMSFKFYAAVHETGVGVTVYDLTDGPTGSVNATAVGVTARTPSAVTWKIGEQGSAAGTVPIDMAWVGLCQGNALSVPTLTAVYQSVKASLALRNISV